MAPTTMSIGGTNVPFPREKEPFGMEYIPFGASRRMADASYRVQLTGAKWRTVVYWEGLTQAERNTLFGAYTAALTTSSAVVFPDGGTYNMMSGLSSWNEDKWYSFGDSGWYYDISFALEEV